MIKSLTKENKMDEIAEVIETLENYTAAMTLPVPAEIHMNALREGIPELRDRLKLAYLELGGEDHWK